MEGGLVMSKIYFNFSRGSLQKASRSHLFIQTYTNTLNHILYERSEILKPINRETILKKWYSIGTLDTDFLEETGIHSIKITPSILSHIQRVFSKVDKNIKIRYRLTPGESIHTKETITTIIKEDVEINQGPKVTDLILCQKMLDLKRSADDRSIPFSLSFKKLKYLWSRPRCQITREPFNWVENSPSNPQWKSIDRWDNSKGYTDDNSIICSQRINTRKGNLSLEDLEFLFKFHQKRLKK